MSNTKEINPKTGPRVAELIKGLNMTQAEFGDKLGLGSRQISCIVTGKRRLTEDNARRISELFPPVRFEWLMGWDDYMTTDHLKLNSLIEEANYILRDSDERARRLYLVADVLRELGYSFKPLIWNTNNLLEFHEHLRFLQKHEDEFLYFFSEDEIREAYKKRNQQMCEEYPQFVVKPSDEWYHKYYDPEWIIHNPDEYLNHIKSDAYSDDNVYNYRMNYKNKKFHIVNSETNKCYECTYAERDRFINQIYDILNLLVLGAINQLNQGHIEPLSETSFKCFLSKSSKEYYCGGNNLKGKYKIRRKSLDLNSKKEETNGKHTGTPG